MANDHVDDVKQERAVLNSRDGALHSLPSLTTCASLLASTTFLPLTKHDSVRLQQCPNFPIHCLVYRRWCDSDQPARLEVLCLHSGCPAPVEL